MNTRIRSFLTKYLWIFPVFIGFVLRIFEITRSSIWHDEGYTMWLLRYDFAGIIERTARDVHPPGYYLLAKPWVSIFGNSVFSIRFLSLIFSVGIIYLTYRIIESTISKKAAYWASLFVAFSPFMIRFGQEARMYGVVAFFTTLATYYFIRFIKDKTKVNLSLVLFTLSMIVAMYTQYYSFFVIISLWVIYAVITPEFWSLHWIKAVKEARGVFSWKWWLANAALLALYAPWFPVAYKQVTRVGGSYWIKPEWITINTIPANVSQFLTYTHMNGLLAWQGPVGVILYWIVISFLIGVGLFLFLDKKGRATAAALYIFGYLPMVLVFVVSKLKTPIYQDRYFPFSAIAIFAIWGGVVALIRNNRVRMAAGIAVLLVMTIGIVLMRTDVNHQMKQVTDEIKAHKIDGDLVVSGSLYTFLDGSYYFNYKDIKLVSKSVDGYGETSLFYDQADSYILNPNRLASMGSRVWVLGRSGEDYISETPLRDWKVSATVSKGSVRAVLYTR
jgi:mannosyltransferase